MRQEKKKEASKRPVKTAYSSDKLKAKRQLKRDQAEDRQFEWEKKTTEQKLNSLAGRRGKSSKQIKRLSK